MEYSSRCVMKKLALILISVALVAALILGVSLFTGTQPSGKSFKEAYSSAKKLTFSLGEGSVITWEESVVLSYGNISSPLNSSTESILVRNLTWPSFNICLTDGASEGECADVFFHMIAFPQELVGVDSINLPSLLYENLTILMVNKGLVELETGWKSSKAFNYTNSTSNHPAQNISTVTKLYVEPESGLVVRGDISLIRAGVSLTFTYKLAS
ncbi:MAG: FKBP-type peptidyl-prolyl cis-trans isomerase, partial [Candidatus Korarchaeum sp.]|nr:FKBP-type peptidyl-prolyl cis-trans isomerase [Candidatus Korarchaeum sp.]MDW8035583.1 hypothetical protein [Candidatus Korarchaeum sp.]